MNDIHTNKGVKCQCSPEGMIHRLIRIGFDPFLNHVCVHVVSIYFMLHAAISNHMFVHDNIGIAKLRAFKDRDLRSFMDRGADFCDRTARDVQDDNQHGEEENWIHLRLDE